MDRGPREGLTCPTISISICKTRKRILYRVKIMQHDDLIISFLVCFICHDINNIRFYRTEKQELEFCILTTALSTNCRASFRSITKFGS